MLGFGLLLNYQDPMAYRSLPPLNMWKSSTTTRTCLRFAKS